MAAKLTHTLTPPSRLQTAGSRIFTATFDTPLELQDLSIVTLDHAGEFILVRPRLRTMFSHGEVVLDSQLPCNVQAQACRLMAWAQMCSVAIVTVDTSLRFDAYQLEHVVQEPLKSAERDLQRVLPLMLASYK